MPVQINAAHPAATTGADLEILAFRVGSEEYGIPIHAVQELRGYDQVTQLANTAPMLKGVVNLRGVIVPIVDLRIQFGCANPVYDQLTVVIILKVGKQTFGMAVDSVADVVALGAAQCRPAPALGATGGAAYITGIGTIDERMIALIDLDALFLHMQLAAPVAHAA